MYNTAEPKIIESAIGAGPLGGAVFEASELLKLVQQGDQQAMMSLYDRYSRLVYSIALRILHSPNCAEDVVQDIFMQIWRSPERFIAVQRDFSGWMAVVARNRSIDKLRCRRPSESIEDVDITSPYNLANHAEQNLLCEKIRILINDLSEIHRRVLEMAFFDDMSHSEIAEALGWPLGTTKTRIRSALSALRRGLENSGATLRYPLPLKGEAVAVIRFV